MNEAAADLHQKPEQPKNDEYHQDGPQHMLFSLVESRSDSRITFGS
jgi:hypothetical protein